MSAVGLHDEHKALNELACAFVSSAALHTAARLGVADRLGDGPKTADELAADLGADADALQRVLRLLASHGVFTHDGQGRFALTRVGEPLRRDVPGSLVDGVIMLGNPIFWASAGALDHGVASGEPTFEHLYGTSFYNYFAAHPDGGFHEGMAALSAMEDGPVADALSLPAGAVVADIGGGSGGLLAEVLARDETVRGVLFDTPHVLDLAHVPDRCELVAGDFFEAVPEADVYVMKRILHNWSDDQCVRILENCRRSMRPGGRVLVADGLVSPSNGRDFMKVFDVYMMLFFRSRERTEAELGALFDAAGLRLSRTIPTDTFISVVEGTP